MVRALFCGLGSIGCRHLRDMDAVMRERGVDYEAHALRSTSRELPADIAPLIRRSFTEPPAEGGYDVGFVCNPSSLHADAIRSLAPLCRSLFIEKPVFTDPDTDLGSLGLADGGYYYVACPLRYSAALRRAAGLADAERVVGARAICSSYLPDWRPGADYASCYSSRRELGGGVPLDLIHEWDYLTALFGFPDEARGYAGHLSALRGDSDDLAVYIARYPDKLLSLQLDYIGRRARRELELYTDSETYVLDIIGSTVRALRADTLERLTPVDFLRAELEHFLERALNGGGENENTVENAARVLRLALSAR